MREVPGVVDLNSDMQNKGLQASLAIDRTTASRLGISPKALDDTLYDAFGQRQVSTMYTQLNQYHVVMEVEPELPAEPRRTEISIRARLQGAGAPERLHQLRTANQPSGR